MAINDCDCNSSETSAQKKCNSAKGVSVCDQAYLNLPTSTFMKLIGVVNECIYVLEDPAQNAIIVVGPDGNAVVTNAPDVDLPALVNLIGGGPDEDTPPTFDHLMVMDGTEWKKWRGPTATSGFVFWDHTVGVWKFGQMNENGICTATVIDGIDSPAHMAVFDDADNPDQVGSKCLKRLVPAATADLYYVDTSGVLQRVNPTGAKGFVYFEQDDLCNPAIIPRVRQLCEITQPPCDDPPAPNKLLGCSSEGDPADTGATPTLPAEACAFVPVALGDAYSFAPSAIGRTFFPAAHGVLRSATASTGNVNNTITSGQIAAAAGYTPPGTITHVVLWTKALITATTDAERKELLISLEGIDAASISAYSWDNATEDRQESISELIIPVGGSGEVAFDLTHSSAVASTYTYSVQIAGFFCCPDTSGSVAPA